MCRNSHRQAFPSYSLIFLGIAIKIPFLGKTAAALRHTSLAFVNGLTASQRADGMQKRN